MLKPFTQILWLFVALFFGRAAESAKPKLIKVFFLNIVNRKHI